MANILKKAQEVVSKADQEKRQREEAQRQRELKAAADKEAARIQKEKDDAAEAALAGQVKKKLAALDKKIDQAFAQLAQEAGTEALTYTHAVQDNNIIYTFESANVAKLEISLQAIFNKSSGVKKKLLGIECYVDDYQHAKTKLGETERRDTWAYHNYTQYTLQERAAYSAPANTIFTDALSDWFATAVTKNDKLAAAVRTGKISGDLDTGLTDPKIPPQKRTEWVKNGQKEEWSEETRESIDQAKAWERYSRD